MLRPIKIRCSFSVCLFTHLNNGLLSAFKRCVFHSCDIISKLHELTVRVSPVLLENCLSRRKNTFTWGAVAHLLINVINILVVLLLGSNVIHLLFLKMGSCMYLFTNATLCPSIVHISCQTYSTWFHLCAKLIYDFLARKLSLKLSSQK